MLHPALLAFIDLIAPDREDVLDHLDEIMCVAPHLVNLNPANQYVALLQEGADDDVQVRGDSVWAGRVQGSWGLPSGYGDISPLHQSSNLVGYRINTGGSELASAVTVLVLEEG